MGQSTGGSRRAFLGSCAAAGAVATIGEAGLGALRLPPPRVPSWVDRPMRWAQLTLVEDDPGKFDPQFWLDYFRRTHSDAVCLSAGGCVAYYPTRSRSTTAAPGSAIATPSATWSPAAASWAWS